MADHATLRLRDLVQAGDAYEVIHGITGRVYATGRECDLDDAAYVLEATATIVPNPLYRVTSDEPQIIVLTVLVAPEPHASHGDLQRFRLPLSRLDALKAAGVPIKRV